MRIDPELSCILSADEKKPHPERRYGHVAWTHNKCMFVFGGKRVVNGGLEGEADRRDRKGRPPYYVDTYNNIYLNDLWVWEIDHERWTRIKPSGLHPSPRADMGESPQRMWRPEIFNSFQKCLCTSEPKCLGICSARTCSTACRRLCWMVMTIALQTYRLHNQTLRP